VDGTHPVYSLITLLTYLQYTVSDVTRRQSTRRFSQQLARQFKAVNITCRHDETDVGNDKQIS